MEHTEPISQPKEIIGPLDAKLVQKFSKKAEAEAEIEKLIGHPRVFKLVGPHSRPSRMIARVCFPRVT